MDCCALGSTSSSERGTGRRARPHKSSSAATEEAPTLILHIDVDNGMMLSSNFVRTVPTTDRAAVSLEAAAAKDFASHLLAEFMWGTLDPSNGAWLPVEDAPSSSPPGGDDSLITYGQYLRAHRTAEPLQNPQVCENLRKALQSFGQQPPRKTQERRGGQRKRVQGIPEGNVGRDEAKTREMLSSERALDMHAQVLKRMMLPLTLRLALGCERADPARTLSIDRTYKAPRPKTDSSNASCAASSGATHSINSSENAVAASAPPVEDCTEGRQNTLTCSYTERLKEGYWHTAPSIFHTLFAWLKRKRPLKIILYTRDYPEGPHITRVIQEWNDLCEGTHPAFDGQNRTKQVFLDGRKKSSDMRVLPAQVGSVKLFSRKQPSPFSSGMEPNEVCSDHHETEGSVPSDCAPTSHDVKSAGSSAISGDGSASSAGTSHLQCPRGPRVYSPAEASVSPEFAWQANFPSAQKNFNGIHEFYAGLIYDLLAERSVICLCFGSLEPATACSQREETDPSVRDDKSAAAAAEHGSARGDLGDARPTASVLEEWQGSAPPLSSLSNDSGQEQAILEPKSAASRGRPLADTLDNDFVASTAGEGTCYQLEGTTVPAYAESAPQRHSGRSGAGLSLERVPILFSLDAPLVPLPVAVDPVDYSLFHVCISAPALLDVQHGLSYLPSLKVVEVVGGATVFNAMLPLSRSCCPPQHEPIDSIMRAAEDPYYNTRYIHGSASVAEVVASCGTGEPLVDSRLTKSVEESKGLSVPSTGDASASVAQTTLLQSYLVVSPAYCIVITEPLSLLCNPEHLLRLTDRCLDCRLRQLKCGKTEDYTVVLTVESAEQTHTTAAAAGSMHATSYAAPADTEKPGSCSFGAESVAAKPTKGDAPHLWPNENPNPSAGFTQLRTFPCSRGYAAMTPEQIKALHPRDYLKATVVPVLLPAIEQILKDRPEDPLAWIAFYLLRHAEGYERTAR